MADKKISWKDLLTKIHTKNLKSQPTGMLPERFELLRVSPSTSQTDALTARPKQFYMRVGNIQDIYTKKPGGINFFVGASNMGTAETHEASSHMFHAEVENIRVVWLRP